MAEEILRRSWLVYVELKRLSNLPNALGKPVGAELNRLDEKLKGFREAVAELYVERKSKNLLDDLCSDVKDDQTVTENFLREIKEYEKNVLLGLAYYGTKDSGGFLAVEDRISCYLEKSRNPELKKAMEYMQTKIKKKKYNRSKNIFKRLAARYKVDNYCNEIRDCISRETQLLDSLTAVAKVLQKS